ncbi:MAG: hypothetical protein LBV12_07295 [Puniceicoccales bacterium]|jgi:hypothetical protein|nr:hypothetical protein [Puniceicoccales bacterium]
MQQGKLTADRGAKQKRQNILMPIRLMLFFPFFSCARLFEKLMMPMFY